MKVIRTNGPARSSVYLLSVKLTVLVIRLTYSFDI